MRSGEYLLASSLLALVTFAPLPVLAADLDSAPIALTTQAENRLSFTLSDYYYYEPSLDVTFAGPKGGIGYYRAQPLTESFFGIFEIDYRFGPTEYSWSGVSGEGIPEYYIDGKIALGRDFNFENFVISPYVGLGYRRLFNEFGTLTNSYDRMSQYWYIPVGLIHRIGLGSDARLETMVEGDILLAGYQESKFSQYSPDWQDVHNTQSRGYGIKASMMYQRDHWGIGPYLNYWNIEDSDSDSTPCYPGQVCKIFEPANSTTEYGVEFQLSSLGLSDSSSGDGSPAVSSDGMDFYAGIQGSFLVPDFDVSNDVLGNGEIVLESAGELLSGALGVYLGGELHASHNITIGLEFDVNTTNASQNGDAVEARHQQVPVENSYSFNSYGSGRLRLGYSYGSIMPYITGGVALANIEVGSDYTEADYQLDGSDWVYGYTLGVGAEYMINDMFRVRAEYRYSDFGTTDITIKTGYDEPAKTTYEVDVKSQALTLGVGMVF